MRNISKMLRDREFVSTEHHYKEAYGLSEEVKIFDLWWPWKIKVTNRNLTRGIPRKWYEIESSCQQKIIIKLHIGFPKKMKYLTIGDPERSSHKPKSYTRNISKMVRDREIVLTEHPYKVAYVFSKRLKYLTFEDPERSRSQYEILDAEYLANGTR